jgi:uncharacterized protein (UPF0335 family)
VQKIERLEDEKVALEDDLCDDPENSEKFDVYPVNDATLAFAEHNKEDKEELKEVCNNYEDAEWNNGECGWKGSDRESVLQGFGDECEDSDFRER